MVGNLVGKLLHSEVKLVRISSPRFSSVLFLVTPSLFGHAFRAWTLWVGNPFLVIGLTVPQILLYPYKIWMALGNALGWVNSHIILGLIFIVILQPIAYIMRLTGYDPLRNKISDKRTYRENRKDHQIDLPRIF